jgi:oligopeptide/dipeptide ABC transporter ATP-binding protein
MAEHARVDVPGAYTSDLLRVEDLTTDFYSVERRRSFTAVREVGLAIRPGETLGLVGESGSGKSVTMMSILGLVGYGGGRVSRGRVWFEGEDLLSLPPADLRRIRGGKIGAIFQDPMTSLNPVLTIGWQLTESLRTHLGMGGHVARARAVELLEMVRIPDARRRLHSYPHELSGGMRQRVMIALALSCNPKLLLADEPTTALDVTVQAQILELIAQFAHERRMAVLIISHDFGVIARLADRVAVMYAGSLVETAAANELFKHPRHPYTLGLLRSQPRLDVPRNETLPAIRGSPPDPIDRVAGCPFQPRCPFAVDRCKAEEPHLRAVSWNGEEPHRAACWVDLDDSSVFADLAPTAV